MTNFQFEKNTKNKLQAVMILPSQAVFTDLAGTEHLNRGASEPKENLDSLMLSIISRGGIVTPLKGYAERTVNGVVFKITAGSRRLAAAQALEAEEKIFHLPVLLIDKPKSAEEIAEALLDSAADNNWRSEDSAVVLHASFKALTEMGLTRKQIQEKTGYGTQTVYHYLKSFEIKPLREAIVSGKINPRAAAEFFTKEYAVLDPKTGKQKYEIKADSTGNKTKEPVWDEKKIGESIKRAESIAQDIGKPSKKGKITLTVASNTKKDRPGMKAVHVILDEPDDNIPTMFRLFCRWLDGNLPLTEFKSAAKKNRFTDEIEWLFDIEFDVEKRKEAKAAAKAKKSTKGKKANPMVESDEEDLESSDYE